MVVGGPCTVVRIVSKDDDVLPLSPLNPVTLCSRVPWNQQRRRRGWAGNLGMLSALCLRALRQEILDCWGPGGPVDEGL